MKTRVLSRFISQVVALILVLGLLAACGGGVQPTAPTTAAPTTAAPTTAAATTAAPTTAAPAPIAAGEVITWRFQSMGVPGMKSYWTYEELVARIKQASGGRLVFQLLPVGAVVGTMESFDAVAKGVVEVGSS